MYAKGYEFDMITDIGSGNNKPGLQQLIKEIVDNQVDKVIVLYKDRLLILGFELVEYICSLRNTELVIVDNHDKSKEEELVEDITVFSCKLGKQTKQMIRDLEHVSNTTNTD
jgi:transposon, resolvase